MKRAVIIFSVLFLFIFASCSDTSDVDPVISGLQSSITTINADITQLKTDFGNKADKSQITTFQDSVNSALSKANTAQGRADEAYNKAQSAQNRADEAYSKANSIVPTTIPNYAQDIADLKARLTTAETKLATLTVQPTPTPTPTGQVVYSVVNPQQFYQFTTSPVFVTLRIFNNTGVSRYVRPTITLTTYGGASATSIDVWADNITIVQNSQGQAVIGFSIAKSVNTIICQGISGGVNNAGEYLINSGNQLEYTVKIYFMSSNPLWNLTVSGDSRPISQ